MKDTTSKWFVTRSLEEIRIENELKKAHERAMRNNTGKPQWSLVDFEALMPLIYVLEFGAQKYERDNWKKYMPANEIMDSMMRHMIAMNRGELVDPESQLPHIGHIMANAMFYSYHHLNHESTARDCRSE